MLQGTSNDHDDGGGKKSAAESHAHLHLRSTSSAESVTGTGSWPQSLRMDSSPWSQEELIPPVFPRQSDSAEGLKLAPESEDCIAGQGKTNAADVDFTLLRQSEAPSNGSFGATVGCNDDHDHDDNLSTSFPNSLLTRNDNMSVSSPMGNMSSASDALSFPSSLQTMEISTDRKTVSSIPSSLDFSMMKMSIGSGITPGSKSSEGSNTIQTRERTKGSSTSDEKLEPLKEGEVHVEFDVLIDFSEEFAIAKPVQHAEGSVSAMSDMDATREIDDDGQLAEAVPFTSDNSSVYARSTRLQDAKGRWGDYSGTVAPKFLLSPTHKRQATGFGSMVYDNGMTYEGSWREGLWHHKGKLTIGAGDHYVGDFYKGGMEGYGKRQWRNDSTYEGEWAQNKRHGSGTFRDCHGNELECNWVQDRAEGHGRHRLACGGTYHGSFLGGKYNGNGTRRWPDGSKYDVYRDGLRIYTTIDSSMQRIAEEEMIKNMKKVQKSFNAVWRGMNPWTYKSDSSHAKRH